jgi:hypothetical protein
MKLRLFALRNTSTGRLIDGYYPDKPAAKKARDELNAQGVDKYVVTPGPDHRRYKVR